MILRNLRRYGLTVLAIWHKEAPILGRFSELPLRLGDTLLVHDPRNHVEVLRDDTSFLLLRPPETFAFVTPIGH